MGVFKIDWALDGPIPWRADACRGAGTVHLGGTLEEIAASERDAWEAHLTAAGLAIAHRTDYTLYVRDPEGNRVGLSHWPDAEPETETA